MSIQYTYEIVKVDAAARCMEVVYSATGRQTLHIGARLPYQEESLESVIAMYAPVAYWEEQDRPVVIPQVGASGTVVPTMSNPTDVPSTPAVFEVTEVVV